MTHTNILPRTHTVLGGLPASKVSHQQSGMADDAVWERQVPENKGQQELTHLLN